MDGFRVLEIKKSVFESNDREADLVREQLKRDRTFLLNLMSSPGSGKTTTLKATIAALKDEFRIGVMEADIDSDVDAATIEKTGAKVIQLHTGGMCHLDAGMTKQGLDGLGVDDVDLAILENVGNLRTSSQTSRQRLATARRNFSAEWIYIRSASGAAISRSARRHSYCTSTARRLTRQRPARVSAPRPSEPSRLCAPSPRPTAAAPASRL